MAGLTCVFDEDGDGYGSTNPPAPFDAGTDCDDSDPYNFPNNQEYCDGVDNNCNDDVDEGNAVGSQTWYLDLDNDTFGIPDVTMQACSQPDGFSPSDLMDCDDTRSDANPNALGLVMALTTIVMEPQMRSMHLMLALGFLTVMVMDLEIH